MPAISSLTRQKPVDVELEFGDEKLKVCFDLNQVTQAWANRSVRMAQDGDTLALARSLMLVIISWDIVNDDGSPYEVTLENIAELPIGLGLRLTQAVQEAAVPSESEGKASSAPTPTPSSASVVPSSTPQNGPAPSPSPELSASQSTS